MNARGLGVWAVVVALLAPSGCGQTNFDAALPLTLEEVDEIRNNENLEPQEKRDLFASFGISETTINGLLAEERLANQFGGDLQSAFDKVVGDALSTLTPDEVQVYGDATAVTTYEDEQALAIAGFFADNNIGSPEDLRSALDAPATQVPDAIDVSDMEAVFIDTDPDEVADQLP